MKKVLMVDDDAAVLFAFKKLCLKAGVMAETAASLGSALWHLSCEYYDMLISDLNLTGTREQEGWEIAQTAKRHNPLIRTCIWTAYDEKKVREKAGVAEIESFLIKPVKFDILLSMINEDPGTLGSKAAE